MEKDVEDFVEQYKREHFEQPALDESGKPQSIWGFPVVIVDKPKPENN